jgi:solute carrier family 25 (mitochondrial carnitine/acylcarnitine transporter), member 20/29
VGIVATITSINCCLDDANIMVSYRLEDLLAGFGAGFVGTLLGYPLDSLKSRMQTSPLSLRQSFLHIYQSDGILGFYRGVSSPLLALTILNTINFSSYSYFHRTLQGVLDDQDYRYLSITAAAMAVGPIASSISTPFELIKLQLQLNRSSMKGSPHSASKATAVREIYAGSMDAVLKITRRHGFRALYLGHGINTSREIVFLGTYFTSYEFIKASLPHESLSSSRLSIPLAGGFAGAVGWFISFPLDCVKSIMQSQNLSHPDLRSVAVFRQLMQSKGFAGLYSGVLPSILRAFVVSSSRFSVYEAILWLMQSSTRSGGS